MDWKHAKKITQWYNELFNLYRTFNDASKNCHYRIVGIKHTDPAKQLLVILVMVSGVKKQIIAYNPEELVMNDNLLGEFSPFDARAITFLALQQHNHFLPYYTIAGQEFRNGKTIFILKEQNKPIEIRKSAQDLYSDVKIINQVSREDLINIISTAVQEQTIADLNKMNH